MSKAKQLIAEKFILPYLSKNTNYIGVELEYPMICLDDQVDTKQLILDLFEQLKTSFDFKDDAVDVEGNLISIKNSIGNRSCRCIHIDCTAVAACRILCKVTSVDR